MLDTYDFQCRGVLLIWITVGQGPTALTVGAGGGCLDIFTLIYPFSPLSPSLWETARYRLKYCLKGLLNPKQPTNQKLIHMFGSCEFFLLLLFNYVHPRGKCSAFILLSARSGMLLVVLLHVTIVRLLSWVWCGILLYFYCFGNG